MKFQFKIYYTGLILLLIGLFLACDTNPNAPVYQNEITIFGYLRGNETITTKNAILITNTQPITDFYDLKTAGIRGASVVLTDQLLSKSYQLIDVPDQPGYYYNDTVLVKPKTTYRLQVKVEGKTVTAATTVPPILQTETQLLSDTTNYVFPKNLGTQKPIYLDCEFEDQIILIDMYCNEEFYNAEIINPFREDKKYPDDQRQYDGGQNGEPRHIVAMAKYSDLRAEMYQNQPVIYWYSAMIVYYGSNTLQVMAIDDNYHHFLYKENPEFNSGVRGGIGVFGSVTGKKFKLMVQKP